MLKTVNIHETKAFIDAIVEHGTEVDGIQSVERVNDVEAKVTFDPDVIKGAIGVYLALKRFKPESDE